LLELLEEATDAKSVSTITVPEEERLEAIHYQLWINQRGEHIESIIRSVEVKIASLKSSHQARVALLEEQRDQATDARIIRMKESQLDSANRDFEQRLLNLNLVAGQSEIVAELAVLGVLTIQA